MHDGICGISDPVERAEEADTVSYEGLDAKLTREAAKPGHMLWRIRRRRFLASGSCAH